MKGISIKKRKKRVLGFGELRHSQPFPASALHFLKRACILLFFA